MHQQINLFTTLPKPPKYYLSDQLMFLIITSTIALLLLTTLIQAILIGFNHKKLSELQKEYAIKQQSFAQTSALFEKNSTAILQDELNQKKALLQSLQSRKITSGECSFLSNYFNSLAESSVSGLWLTRININLINDQINLAGNTYTPTLLMELVKNLNNTNCFSSRDFGPLNLTKNNEKENKDILQFAISSSKGSIT